MDWNLQRQPKQINKCLGAYFVPKYLEILAWHSSANIHHTKKKKKNQYAILFYERLV